jgi:hypothetical protein
VARTRAHGWGRVRPDRDDAPAAGAHRMCVAEALGGWVERPTIHHASRATTARAGPEAGRAMTTDLLRLTPEGLHCAAGDFWVDPWRPVPRAVVTHAHSDHARWGCDAYLASRGGRARAARAAGRLGPDPRGIVGRSGLDQRRPRLAAPRRSHPRLGAGPHRAPRRGRRGVGRLQDRAGPYVHAVGAAALRHLRHGIDLRPADLPVAVAGVGVRGGQPLVARQRRSRPREPDPGVLAGEGAADPGRAGPVDRPDLHPRRGGEADRRLPR